MWLKIRTLFHKINLPVSVKLTLLYTFILFLTLLLTSHLTFLGVRFALDGLTRKNMEISMNNVVRYLEAGNPVEVGAYEQHLLMPEMVLRIFNEKGILLYDSYPFEKSHLEQFQDNHSNLIKPILPEIPESPALLTPDTVNEPKKAKGKFDYITSWVSVGDITYQVQIIRLRSFQVAFLKTLMSSLFITNFIGLLIAVLSGIFISRKILSPIKTITETAKQIEVNNLEQRLPVGNNKDELAELADTFNHMLNRIHAGFEQQQRFVADASHELRTPVTVIRGYADMIDRWGKERPDALNEGILAIKQETAYMQTLIEKLLFLARAEQGMQALKKLPLETAALVEELYQETCLIAPDHQVLLKENQSAQIIADSFFIKQMLRIFIENSIKYTPQGKEIRLSARVDDKYLEITVQDTGIGIPLEEQPNIFHRFYRVDKSRSKETGGTGLGLSIALWIAKQHDIQLQVTSELEQGTTITARIPCILPATNRA